MNYLLRHLKDRKFELDERTQNASERIVTLNEWIRQSTGETETVKAWRDEIRQCHRKQKLIDEEFAALCRLVESRTEIRDAYRRNSDATNLKLRGEKWARAMLGL